MSQKFSYQGVVIVIICGMLIIYYNILFRDARRKDLQRHLLQDSMLLNNQK